MIAKVHPNFPDYEIRDDGRVFRIRPSSNRRGRTGVIGEIRGRVLKESGYRQFKLCCANGGQALVRANRLVAEVFHGPPPTSEHHACHNDGIRLNNRADNLRWDLPKENNADQVAHGTRLRGSRSPRSRLSDIQRDEIKGLFTGKRGEIKSLAKQYDVSQQTVARTIFGEYGGVGHGRMRQLPSLEID